MSKKFIFLLISGLVVFVVVVGVFVLENRKVYAPEGDTIMSTQPDQEQGAVIIAYTNEGFSPKSITIQKGTEVEFVNQSEKNFWPASALHPTHEVYPDKESPCGTSAFDACEALAPGASWTFTFNEVGTWRYHDHINASYTGTIIVE